MLEVLTIIVLVMGLMLLLAAFVEEEVGLAFLGILCIIVGVFGCKEIDKANHSKEVSPPKPLPMVVLTQQEYQDLLEQSVNYTEVKEGRN